MEESKIDKRSKKTEYAIKTALIRCMTRKPLSHIKIKELCDEADINRSTFYLHYYDVYDVLECIENETAEMIFALCNNFDYEQLIRNPYPLLKLMSEQLDKDSQAGNFLSKSSEAPGFLNKIKKLFRELLINYYKDKHGSEGEIELFYVLTFITSGVIDVYEEWLKSDKKLSLDNLCSNIGMQISNGLTTVINKII